MLLLVGLVCRGGCEWSFDGWGQRWELVMVMQQQQLAWVVVVVITKGLFVCC